ncbi:hypothetical protein [Paenibacillus donghaensis]|uniref:hypothetical protein n=1 Tax=Paenibacillus donghaensis TaxID=414771 RepID=UPI001D16968F|nr:hypothetical protein [Paenibacillus donghaensis]
MKYMENQSQKYHVLARGIIISEENLLVAHFKGMDNTFLPGGHVEFREGMRNQGKSKKSLDKIVLYMNILDVLKLILNFPIHIIKK